MRYENFLPGRLGNIKPTNMCKLGWHTLL